MKVSFKDESLHSGSFATWASCTTEARIWRDDGYRRKDHRG